MKQHIKQALKHLLYRPRGLAMGANSHMMWPRSLRHPERMQIGRACHIGPHCVFNALDNSDPAAAPGRIVLGDDVYVGGYTQIHAMNHIELSEGCVLSEHVYVSDVAHGLDPRAGPIMKQPNVSRGPVRLGRHVFIGYGCAVMPGVTLGEHCVVGARSVVTRSYPAYSMLAGSPARLIKTFNTETGLWEAVR
jgi:carbonic anhydrase/acetyltransferase-like protein (isoleucine patch superfamily)